MCVRPSKGWHYINTVRGGRARAVGIRAGPNVFWTHIKVATIRKQNKLPRMLFSVHFIFTPYIHFRFTQQSNKLLV